MSTTTTNGTTKNDLPLLKRSATVNRQNGHVVIRHLRDEVTLEGAAAELFSKLQGQLDGETAIDAIAQKIAEKPARLRSLVEELGRAGVVAFLSARTDGAVMTGLEFHALHRDYAQHWLEPVYA